MIFVDLDEPLRNVLDTGQTEAFMLYPGSRISFRSVGGMNGTWDVVTQVSRDVVLLRRPVEP